MSSDHVYGGMPPLACNIALYGCPWVPDGNDVVVTAGASAFGFTVMLSARLSSWPFRSLTWIVKLLVPVEPGVPEIAPLLEFSINPPGKLPTETDQFKGGWPLVTVRRSP